MKGVARQDATQAGLSGQIERFASLARQVDVQSICGARCSDEMGLAMLVKAEGGSAAACQFQGLVVDHLCAAYRLAYLVVANSADAEDAVQDAAFTAWRRWDTLRDVSPSEGESI